MMQTNLGFMLANRELITKLFMVRKTLVTPLQKIKYINKGFSVSSIPQILCCKSSNRPPGGLIYFKHMKIKGRETKKRQGGEASNYFPRKKGGAY